jgi:hypothetical protein
MGHTQFNCLEQGLIHTTELVNLEEIIYKSINLAPTVEKDLILFIAATLKKEFTYPLKFLQVVIMIKMAERDYQNTGKKYRRLWISF